MSQTTFTLFVLVVMLAVFMAAWWRRLPNIISMLLAAIAGALVAGQGVPLRHLVEGMFMFFDLVVTILTATIFVGMVRASGALHGLIADLVRRFHRRPLLLLMLMTIVVMIPGTLTGSGTAAVLSVGPLVGAVLVSMGIPVVKAVAVVALGGVIGAFAPPVNIPAMAIANGINMPYSGFTVPLVLFSLPLGLGSVLWMGARYVRKGLDVDKIMASLPAPEREVSRLGVGALVQIMALTGVRGLFVITAITLPETWLYLFTVVGFALAGALFGSYGSGTVLGVPLMLALLDRDPVIATVGLSLMACYGSLTPPTAVVGFGAQVALNHREPYSTVLREVIWPWVVASIIGMLIVIYADQLRFLVVY